MLTNYIIYATLVFCKNLCIQREQEQRRRRGRQRITEGRSKDDNAGADTDGADRRYREGSEVQLHRASTEPRSFLSPHWTSLPALSLHSTTSRSLQPHLLPQGLSIWKQATLHFEWFVPKTNLNDPPQFSPSTNSKFSMLNSVLHLYSKGKFSKQNFLKVT